MKQVKLLVVILLTAMVCSTSISALAANKADKQRQAQQKKQAKKQIKDNKKYYKEKLKPKFKQQKAENKKAQKQAKNDRKQAIKDLKKADKEQEKFSKARDKAKAALLKQKQKTEAAIAKYEANPSAKNLKTRDKLLNSYKNSYNNYQQGPKQRWLDKKAARELAEQNFVNKDRGYKKTLEDGAIIARDKIKAKLAINKTQDRVPVNQYDRVPSLTDGYDRLPPPQMNHYESPEAALGN